MDSQSKYWAGLAVQIAAHETHPGQHEVAGVVEGREVRGGDRHWGRGRHVHDITSQLGGRPPGDVDQPKLKVSAAFTNSAQNMY